jgi:adenylate kinase family enzyme
MNIQKWLATHQPGNGRFFTIAIDGRGGCGKSTLAELLKAKLPDFVVLNGDDYFELVNDPIVWGKFNDDRFVREKMPQEKIIPAWKLWQQREDEYIRDFKPQGKADIIIDGTKSFEEQL